MKFSTYNIYFYLQWTTSLMHSIAEANDTVLKITERQRLVTP